MNTEEKILAILEEHSKLFEKLNTQMDQMQDDITGLKAGQSAMQDDITAIKLRLDCEVDKRFNAISEGIDAILENLSPKSRVDELESDVIVLKTAVKMLTQEVAELKKAQ